MYYSSGALRDIEDPPVVEEIPSKSDQEIITDCMGDTIIELSENTLVRMDLPDVYYPGIDFTSSQPYEDYSCITNRRSAAYQITRSDNAYTDENGYRRYTTTDNQFTIDGESDYVVALGTFYKPKGTCGSRFLVITSEGMYTIITGDEKDDRHTDEMNMFSRHGDNAGMIEFLVDSSTLYHADNMAARMGSIHYSSIPELSGEILAMYRID
ncbi:MAG: hypothetical protein K2N48_07205 [Muribaculaceae bacterium]|nr:hypothetical protein [Muribaculaceae bacterium]